MPLLTKPLSPQERRAVTLRRQGMSNREIADEMMLTDGHVASILAHAKRKGAVFPAVRTGKPCKVDIERLVSLRHQLRQAGYERGLSTIIAERTGMSVGTVKVRLWRYDQRQQGEKAA